MANDRPEQDLLAQIDALAADADPTEQEISEALRRGPTDDYMRPYKARCHLCNGDWHGLPVEGDSSGNRQRGCPGAYATPAQEEVFKKTLEARRKLVPMRSDQHAIEYAEAVDAATMAQHPHGY